ncbi:MAG TPA: response regulator [Methylophilaceae bacterium]|nr:response regulator [Methylophilaceae bacterium]
MTIATSVSQKKVLVIDDVPEIRNQLQMSLTSLGFEKLHVVSDIKEAMEKMEHVRYDVILCDYNLGEGTNGQQFLEYLRTRDLLPRNAVFIIITAQNSYESVASAAECVPDDYLLKPFTAGQFLTRFEKLMQRQAFLATIDKAHDSKNWHMVITECDKILAQKDKHYIEICKIKAAALMRIDRPQEAMQVYSAVLQLRELPWAQLGIARAQAKLGNLEAAKEISAKLIESNPKFIATYDFMSELMLQSNDSVAALEVLKSANAIIPSNINRTRHLTALAMTNGQHDMAENLMTTVLKKHKHSPVREASDFALLSRSLSEQGKTNEALSVLKEAGTSFKDSTSMLVLSASASIAHRRAGNLEAAEISLSEALAGDTMMLPPQVAASLAEACYDAGKEQEADGLLKQILQNNPDDMRLQGKVKMVCAMAGKDMTASNIMIEESAKEIIRINNDGVRKAQAGEYEEAIKLITAAAQRLPNNMNIVSNAALILAASIANRHGDENTMKQCLLFRQKVVAKNAAHPKLAQIDMMLKKAQVAA